MKLSLGCVSGGLDLDFSWCGWVIMLGAYELWK